MTGNSILDMILKSKGTVSNSDSPVDFTDMINKRFGNVNNAMRQLQGLMGRKGMNPEQIARENLKGMTFSNETIEQFKTFAKQSGMSDEQINDGLRRAGIIK